MGQSTSRQMRLRLAPPQEFRFVRVRPALSCTRTSLFSLAQLPSPASPTPCNPAHNESCVVRTVAWLPLPATSSGGASAAISASPVVLLLAAVPALGVFVSAGPDYGNPTGWSLLLGSDCTRRGQPPRCCAHARGTDLGHGERGRACGAASCLRRLAAAGRCPGTCRVRSETPGAPFAGVAVSADGLDVAVMTLEFNSSTSIYRSLDGGKASERA